MVLRAPHRGKIVLAGMCFHLPLAGVVYQVLHYLIGLRQLGYDVYYVEDSTRWPYDTEIEDVVADATKNVGLVAAVFDAHGFSGRWAFRGDYEGGRCYGMEKEQILRLYGEADALLNITGAGEIREDHFACQHRVYIESDPFASQVRIAQGDLGEIARLATHQTHFTFGENLGAPDCDIPQDGFRWLDGFRWMPTRQPVAMELWAPPEGLPSATAAYRTVTTWKNHVESIVYRGETYHWQKHLEFEKFLDLPRHCPQPFELASNMADDTREMLREHGWHPIHVNGMAEDVDRYRAYIWGSRGEFTVSREQYVRPRTGWFSDRSACYLAAARPVIAQDTAFGKFLPTGRGLFAFTTMDDIRSAVDAIETDYEAHSRAAREIAAEYFAAEKVVGSLMERAGL